MDEQPRDAQELVLKLLEDGRAHLDLGQTSAALGCAEQALGLAREAGLTAAIRASGELLVAAASQEGCLTALGSLAEELYESGVRSGALVAALACSKLAQPSLGLADLELLVSALELGHELDSQVHERILRVLADSLDVDLSAAPSTARPLRPLLERVLAACPKSSFPLLQLGRFFYLQGDFAAARHHFSLVSERLGASPRLLNLRGRCAEKLSFREEALVFYRRSLAEDPNQSQVHFWIGRILLHRFASARA